jgi:hypothetical protein
MELEKELETSEIWGLEFRRQQLRLTDREDR